MGQQPSIPEGSLQVLVPSGLCCVSSGDKTLPEMTMKPFLMNSVSICCEVFGQHIHMTLINGLQHRVLSGHILPNGHPFCNKD